MLFLHQVRHSPTLSSHTTQCSTYLKTGQAKIIGVGRDVPVVRKDGTLMGAHLTVTEKRDGEKVFFVGILQPK